MPQSEQSKSISMAFGELSRRDGIRFGEMKVRRNEDGTFLAQVYARNGDRRRLLGANGETPEDALLDLANWVSDAFSDALQLPLPQNGEDTEGG